MTETERRVVHFHREILDERVLRFLQLLSSEVLRGVGHKPDRHATLFLFWIEKVVLYIHGCRAVGVEADGEHFLANADLRFVERNELVARGVKQTVVGHATAREGADGGEGEDEGLKRCVFHERVGERCMLCCLLEDFLWGENHLPWSAFVE